MLVENTDDGVKRLWSLAPGPRRLGRAAVPAVVGALGLDAAALGALVDHLSGLQLQALHVLFSSVSFGYCPLRFNNNVF